MEQLNQKLNQIRRRIRLAVGVRFGLHGGGVGIIAGALLVTFAGRFLPVVWEYPLWLVALVCGLIGIAIGAVASLFVPVNNLIAARVVEQRASLKDRVSSAVLSEGAHKDISAPITRDAVEHVEAVDIKDAMPLVQLPHFKLPAASVAVLLIAALLPVATVMNNPEKAKEQLKVKQQGAQLQKVAAALKREPAVNQQSRDALSQQLQSLGKQLESGRVSGEEARLKMNKLEAALRDEADKIDKKTGLATAWMTSEKFDAAKAELIAKNAATMDSSVGKMSMSELNKLQAKKGSGGAQGSGEGLNNEGNNSSVGTGQVNKANGSKTSLPTMSEAMASKKSANGAKGPVVPEDLAKRLAELYANKDFKEALKLMQELQKKLGQDMSASERQQTAQDLEALAKALKDANLDELAKQMKAAAEALSKMDKEELKKRMQSACKACNKLGLAAGQSSAFSSAAGALSSGRGQNEYVSTNKENKGGRGNGNDPNAARDPSKNKLDRNFTKLYDPRKTDSRSKSMRANSQIGDQGEVEKLEVEGAPDPGEKSTVPYQEVMPSYRNAAEKALSKDNIPIGEKKKVREYFDSLR